LERVSRDILGLHLGPYFIVNETKGLDDIYLWSLDETSDLGTRENMAREIQAFSQLQNIEKIREIVNRLHILCNNKSIPCLIDQGGVLDEFGKYRSEYVDLINSFVEDEEDKYLAFLHRRSPAIVNIENSKNILHQRIKPLELHESHLLLQRLCRDLKPSSDVLQHIAEYLDGYPPAAYFTARHAQTYGIDATVSDKSLLVDFKARSFTRFVSDLNLSDQEWRILQYLSSEQLVPLAAVAVAVESNSQDTAQLLRNLIDNSLVVVVDDNYGVSPPIRDAIFRAKGHITKEMYNRIRINLTKEFWSDSEAAPTIEVVDATLHAVARSGSTEFDPYRDLVRVSIVHRLAQECYYRKEWELALEYAKRAERMGANRQDVRSICFKALVQLEKWQEAESQLEKIEGKYDRQAFYLKGFMLRKRQRFAEAIKAFESALAAGDRSFSVHRDYAECLYREGRFREAFEKIKWALERQPENIYVLDQIIRIYIDSRKNGDPQPVITQVEAEDFLERLERFDLDRRFVHHRKATFLAMNGLWHQALIEAEAACKASYSPFEAHALKIDIFIELGEFTKAEQELNDLAKRFRSQRHNVQLGTRCKLLIRQGKWREAEVVWNNLTDRESPVHQSLRKGILDLKANDPSISLMQRQDAIHEAEYLRSILRVPERFNLLDRDEDFSDSVELEETAEL
jgi:tetratricopeptide (TPR) repeat protein